MHSLRQETPRDKAHRAFKYYRKRSEPGNCTLLPYCLRDSRDLSFEVPDARSAEQAHLTAPPLEMPAPATPAGIDEPVCTACIVHDGLCHRHARDVLPTLAEFPWRKWMGEGYVCSEAHCEEHAKCLDAPGHQSPRAACVCHNCSQRRTARARSAHTDEPSTASLKVQRRDARRARKGTTRSLERLGRAVRGGFTRNRSVDAAR